MKASGSLAHCLWEIEQGNNLLSYLPRDPCAALAAYFICTGLRNRVGKIYLPLLAARGAGSVSCLIPFRTSAHKKDAMRVLCASLRLRWKYYTTFFLVCKYKLFIELSDNLLIYYCLLFLRDYLHLIWRLLLEEHLTTKLIIIVTASASLLLSIKIIVSIVNPLLESLS